MRFEDLVWIKGTKGRCDAAVVRFPNGWEASFLRWPGANASVHMDPSKGYYIGPYEVQPWMPDGRFPDDGPLADCPFHGDAAKMQSIMDLIAAMPGKPA